MKLGFIADLWETAGSSHALLGYADAARSVGVEIAVIDGYGRLPSDVASLVPVKKSASWADWLIVVVEAEQFLSQAAIDKLHGEISQTRICVMDTDGRLSPTVWSTGS